MQTAQSQGVIAYRKADVATRRQAVWMETFLTTGMNEKKRRSQAPVAKPRSGRVAKSSRIKNQYVIQLSDCIAYLKSLPSESVNCVITDPAYSGMNQHLKLGRGRIVGNYQGDANEKWFAEFADDPDGYREFLKECFRVMKPSSHIYIMFDSYSLLTLGPVVREVFDVKNLIVWDKVNIGMGHYFRRQHETILFASKGKKKISRRDLSDVWSVKRLYRAQYPTQKPVEVFAKMLLGSVEPGMVVCDPFVGSGSSAIAALAAGCVFWGSDVSERAVEISSDRCRVFLETGRDPLEP
jgi:site-specific DNA-methyltransferase (adenine-specific)